MTAKTHRAFAIAAALAVAAIGAYWYWSPLLVMNSMKAAAQKQDADAFNQYVDYPKLGESLKGQFNARLAGVVGKASSGSGAEQAGAALGAMLGLAIVDKMIDAMVRPEMVMRAMSEAKMQNPAKGAQETGAKQRSQGEDVKWTIERTGADRVIAYGDDGALAQDAPRVGFVFDRSGFASWRLTEIRLPVEK